MPKPHQLPMFEGTEPIATELTISGGSGRFTRPYRIGDTFALVVEVKVNGVEHKETKGGIVRAHKLALIDAYELGGDRAPDLLESLHEEYEQMLDEMNGRSQLPFEDDDAPAGKDAASGAGAEAAADELEAKRAEREAAAGGEGDGFDALDPDAITGDVPSPDEDPNACVTCGGTGKAKNHRPCKACAGTGVTPTEPAPVE